MLRPDRKEFERLAQTASLVPVVKTVTADLQTPVSAFLSLAEGEKHAFLLESVEGGEKVGRYTFLGIRPYMVLSASEEKIIVDNGSKRERGQGDLFEVIANLLKDHQPAKLPDLPPFTCGAVGFFSYDAVRRIEKIPNTAKIDLKIPDCMLMFFDRVLAFDHVRKQIYIIATANVRDEKAPQAYARAVRDIASLEKRLNAGFHTRKKVSNRKPVKPKQATSRAQFMKGVEKIKEYIRAGDAFQVVYSQRLELEPGVAPFEIYRALRMVNPSPYLYYLRMDDTHVLGSSPEMLVRITGRKLEYRPIAGTLPRGRDEQEDQRLEEHLRSDEKERAEHVMLVDLGRNDIGRVSDYGSVKVTNFMFVERYSHVMHLVSAIEGRLRPELHAIDAFRACFPAGTLSGAPKVRAMEIIEELEPVRRGLYGGSVFYADFAGNLDSCIAIRTLLMKKKKAYLQAGAGIVADSVPESEYQESLNKAQALVKAIEMARRGL
ncbi:MAG TPA: anthranilate synthase component I [Terriglobales bacterium]